MKKLYKTPIEIFCYDVDSQDESFQLAVKQQYCKYIKSTCNKPRKSEPHIKVGICTLGATVARSKDIKPVIICPQRFKEDTMFETIRKKYLLHWKNVKWIPEVNIGVGGSVDYVAIELSDNNEIMNFQCVEIQAAGTTGTPYNAMMEYKQFGKFLNTSYPYGINWANEFIKTMMQQAYKKGKIVESWDRKIIFCIQDVGMEYIQSSSDCSLLTDFDMSLPVDFCTFKLNWTGTAWSLSFDNIYSTSLAGINRIIGGAVQDEYLTVEEFKLNILRKGMQDGIIKTPVI